jgi:hypothetical protein
MNKQILSVAISALLCSGCASVSYKTGQTPDDVYYSPSAGLIYLVPVTDNDNNIADDEPVPYYPSYYPGMINPNYCNYTPYYDGYIYNNYYNPYYSPYPVYTKSYTIPYVNTTPNMVNLNAYSNNTYNNTNTPTSAFSLRPSNTMIKSTHVSSSIGTPQRTIVIPSFNSSNSLDNNTPSYNNSNNFTPSYNNNNSNSSGGINRTYNGGTDNSTGGFSRPARNGR